MSLVFDAEPSSGGDVIAIVESDSDRTRADRAWQQSMVRCFWTGTAGVVQIDQSVVYLTRIGSSPMFRDERVFEQPVPDAAAEGAPKITRQAVLRMSSADQALELLAALSLNKTLLAEMLGVSRPTLYDWFDGKEPNEANAQRLSTLVRILANAGVTAATPLSPRFVRQPLNDGEPSLLELLEANSLDELRVAKLVKEAKALEDTADSDRLAREARLAALGFEEPSGEQRKANVALNVALREWPKD